MNYLVKKILPGLLLASISLGSMALVGCDLMKKTEKTEDTGSNTLGEILETVDPNENTALTVPAELNYGGEDFTVLSYNTMVPEFGNSRSDKPDMIEEALFNRDSYIEETLGVSFVYNRLNGQYADREKFSDTVERSVNGGSQAWDLVGTYSMVAPNLTLKNVLTDLQKLDYIDFSRAWYPQFMLEASTINDKTYFITGDMSTNVLYAMQGVVFNASQANARGLKENKLYQLVYDNEWTVEKMFELCEDLGTELGGDGAWDKMDFYPIVTSDDGCIDSFYFSTGLSLIEEGEDGVLFVSPDVVSEKVMLIYSLIYDAKNTYHSYFNDSANEKAILEERCIFSLSPVVNFRTHWAESPEQFRILPFPKFEAGEAEPYRTFLSMWHTQYCIPNDLADTNRSAAVMEYLGYASYNYVTPAVFEETMKLRYSVNEDCSNMFDIMRDGRTYDVASMFFMSFTPGVYYDAHSLFRNAVKWNTTNWVSHYEGKFAAGLAAVTQQLNDFYAD